MTPEENTRWLRALATEAGLAHVAIARALLLPRHALFDAWLRADHAGEMTYLRTSADDRRDPRALLAQAQTVVCAALSYQHPAQAVEAGGLRGQVARYARSEDYHLVLRRRLQAFAQRVQEAAGRPIAYRVCVDSAPLLEREIAAGCDLGFVGKNTLLITPGVGSYTVLGEVLLDLPAEPGPPSAPRCGSCRLCLDVCPTGALLSEYVLDARRCISYLTIELRGAIPLELRPLMGTWIYGCDLCQEVCPWNAAGRPGDPELRPLGHLQAPELGPLLRIGAAQFRRFVKRTALRRVHRAQLLRNVAVALGNVGTQDEVPALREALGEPSPLVRQHVAWALGRIGEREPGCAAEVRAALLSALDGETEAEVRDELRLALGALGPGAPQLA